MPISTKLSAVDQTQILLQRRHIQLIEEVRPAFKWHNKKKLLNVFYKGTDKILGSSGKGIIIACWPHRNSSRRQCLKWNW